MVIYDSHLHMGHLSDSLTVSPSEVMDFIHRHGVRGGVIMPTVCRGGNDNLKFHKLMYDMAIKRGFKIMLYVNYEVLSQLRMWKREDFSHFSGMKIHPDAVDFNDKELEEVCRIASQINLPLLIHTGDKDSCKSSRFEKKKKKHPEILFLLCHARPAYEAFHLLDKFKNVWIDTSFLPIEELRNRLSNMNEDRILFGTDFPVNRWYEELGDEDEWYKGQIEDIKESFSPETANKILGLNFEKMYL